MRPHQQILVSNPIFMMVNLKIRVRTNIFWRNYTSIIIFVSKPASAPLIELHLSFKNHYSQHFRHFTMTGKVRQGKILTCNALLSLPYVDDVVCSNGHLEEGDSDSSLIVEEGERCKEQFDRKEDLAYHKLIHHDLRKRVMVCKPHKKEYTRINSTSKHFGKMHTSKPNFYDEKVAKQHSELISPIDLWWRESKVVDSERIWPSKKWFENEMLIFSHFTAHESGIFKSPALYVKARWSLYPHNFISETNAMSVLKHRLHDLMAYLTKNDIVHLLYRLTEKPDGKLYDAQLVHGKYDPSRYVNISRRNWEDLVKGQAKPMGMLGTKIYESLCEHDPSIPKADEAQMESAQKEEPPSQQKVYDP